VEFVMFLLKVGTMHIRILRRMKLKVYREQAE
jgi:hypothetical protein